MGLAANSFHSDRFSRSLNVGEYNIIFQNQTVKEVSIDDYDDTILEYH